MQVVWKGSINMRVPYNKPNLPQLDDVDIDEITNIINSGTVSNSQWVEKLEELVRDRFKVKYVLACSNATNGLIIGMKAAGIIGKQVAVQSFTWPSTFYAIDCNRSHPIFCDIDKYTWNIKDIPKEAEAVIAVDTFGNECHIDTNLPVIYDAAHGFDLPNIGKRGIVEVISLSFTKNVTSMEGGLLLTNDLSIYTSAKELRRLTCRMEEINAYLALTSITRYDPEHKRKLIDNYRKNFTFTYMAQTCKNTNNSVFSILFEKSNIRNNVLMALSEAGFESKVYYDPLEIGHKNTDDIYSRIISLPTYKEIEQYQDQIIDIINKSAVDTPGHSYIQKYMGYNK